MLPIVKGLLAGERRALARAISVIDNDYLESHEIIPAPAAQARAH